jgi:hypothetical protein
LIGALASLFGFRLAYAALASLPKDVKPSMDKACVDYERDESHRFIIFRRPMGQGVGNIMSGLLAVHLLGREFNRTVCVHPNFKIFHAAFRPIHADTVEACPRLFECEKPLLGNAGPDGFVRLLNFAFAPNECELQTVLASPKQRMVWIEANTYPRWSATPDGFFLQQYEAKPALADSLPWQSPPVNVVHLRAPDGTSDPRKGLDDRTLAALGRTLPKDTYLVTNKVVWYNQFARDFGWSHPPWEGITHSALALSWGDREGHNIPRVVVDRGDLAVHDLQLFADWYTLLLATSVWHTHSDFSVSAVHWMNTAKSYEIDFCDLQGRLNLKEEEWRQQEIAVPLVQRKDDSRLPERQRLEHCDSFISLSGFMVGRKRNKTSIERHTGAQI